MVRETPSTRIECQSFSHVWHARYVWYVNFFGTYDTPVSLKRSSMKGQFCWYLWHMMQVEHTRILGTYAT